MPLYDADGFFPAHFEFDDKIYLTPEQIERFNQAYLSAFATQSFEVRTQLKGMSIEEAVLFKSLLDVRLSPIRQGLKP